ncbi:hypothetical protein BC832DRAFT_368240 [Gaertneriomyces semiglobifer]|nr:hypothetical protein BC832DRAFT_368240 [Gaertneriomyces semiglobifer]
MHRNELDSDVGLTPTTGSAVSLNEDDVLLMSQFLEGRSPQSSRRPGVSPEGSSKGAATFGMHDRFDDEEERLSVDPLSPLQSRSPLSDDDDNPDHGGVVHDTQLSPRSANSGSVSSLNNLIMRNQDGSENNDQFRAATSVSSRNMRDGSRSASFEARLSDLTGECADSSNADIFDFSIAGLSRIHHDFPRSEEIEKVEGTSVGALSTSMSPVYTLKSDGYDQQPLWKPSSSSELSRSPQSVGSEAHAVTISAYQAAQSDPTLAPIYRALQEQSSAIQSMQRILRSISGTSSPEDRHNFGNINEIAHRLEKLEGIMDRFTSESITPGMQSMSSEYESVVGAAPRRCSISEFSAARAQSEQGTRDSRIQSARTRERGSTTEGLSNMRRSVDGRSSSMELSRVESKTGMEIPEIKNEITDEIRTFIKQAIDSVVREQLETVKTDIRDEIQSLAKESSVDKQSPCQCLAEWPSRKSSLLREASSLIEEKLETFKAQMPQLPDLSSIKREQSALKCQLAEKANTSWVSELARDCEELARQSENVVKKGHIPGDFMKLDELTDSFHQIVRSHGSRIERLEDDVSSLKQQKQTQFAEESQDDVGRRISRSQSKDSRRMQPVEEQLLSITRTVEALKARSQMQQGLQHDAHATADMSPRSTDMYDRVKHLETRFDDLRKEISNDISKDRNDHIADRLEDTVREMADEMHRLKGQVMDDTRILTVEAALRKMMETIDRAIIEPASGPAISLRAANASSQTAENAEELDLPDQTGRRSLPDIVSGLRTSLTGPHELEQRFADLEAAVEAMQTDEQRKLRHDQRWREVETLMRSRDAQLTEMTSAHLPSRVSTLEANIESLKTTASREPYMKELVRKEVEQMIKSSTMAMPATVDDRLCKLENTFQEMRRMNDRYVDVDTQEGLKIQIQSLSRDVDQLKEECRLAASVNDQMLAAESRQQANYTSLQQEMHRDKTIDDKVELRLCSLESQLSDMRARVWQMDATISEQASRLASDSSSLSIANMETLISTCHRDVTSVHNKVKEFEGKCSMLRDEDQQRFHALETSISDVRQALPAQERISRLEERLPALETEVHKVSTDLKHLRRDSGVSDLRAIVFDMQATVDNLHQSQRVADAEARSRSVGIEGRVTTLESSSNRLGEELASVTHLIQASRRSDGEAGFESKSKEQQLEYEILSSQLAGLTGRMELTERSCSFSRSRVMQLLDDVEELRASTEDQKRSLRDTCFTIGKMQNDISTLGESTVVNDEMNSHCMEKLLQLQSEIGEIGHLHEHDKEEISRIVSDSENFQKQYAENVAETHRLMDAEKARVQAILGSTFGKLKGELLELQKYCENLADTTRSSMSDHRDSVQRYLNEHFSKVESQLLDVVQASDRKLQACSEMVVEHRTTTQGLFLQHRDDLHQELFAMQEFWTQQVEEVRESLGHHDDACRKVLHDHLTNINRQLDGLRDACDQHGSENERFLEILGAVEKRLSSMDAAQESTNKEMLALAKELQLHKTTSEEAHQDLQLALNDAVTRVAGITGSQSSLSDRQNQANAEMHKLADEIADSVRILSEKLSGIGTQVAHIEEIYLKKDDLAAFEMLLSSTDQRTHEVVLGLQAVTQRLDNTDHLVNGMEGQIQTVRDDPGIANLRRDLDELADRLEKGAHNMSQVLTRMSASEGSIGSLREALRQFDNTAPMSIVQGLIDRLQVEDGKSGALERRIVTLEKLCQQLTGFASSRAVEEIRLFVQKCLEQVSQVQDRLNRVEDNKQPQEQSAAIRALQDAHDEFVVKLAQLEGHCQTMQNMQVASPQKVVSKEGQRNMQMTLERLARLENKLSGIGDVSQLMSDISRVKSGVEDNQRANNRIMEQLRSLEATQWDVGSRLGALESTPVVTLPAERPPWMDAIVERTSNIERAQREITSIMNEVDLSKLRHCSEQLRQNVADIVRRLDIAEAVHKRTSSKLDDVDLRVLESEERVRATREVFGKSHGTTGHNADVELNRLELDQEKSKWLAALLQRMTALEDAQRELSSRLRDLDSNCSTRFVSREESTLFTEKATRSIHSVQQALRDWGEKLSRLDEAHVEIKAHMTATTDELDTLRKDFNLRGLLGGRTVEGGASHIGGHLPALDEISGIAIDEPQVLPRMDERYAAHSASLLELRKKLDRKVDSAVLEELMRHIPTRDEMRKLFGKRSDADGKEVGTTLRRLQRDVARLKTQMEDGRIEDLIKRLSPDLREYVQQVVSDQETALSHDIDMKLVEMQREMFEAAPARVGVSLDDVKHMQRDLVGQIRKELKAWVEKRVKALNKELPVRIQTELKDFRQEIQQTVADSGLRKKEDQVYTPPYSDTSSEVGAMDVDAKELETRLTRKLTRDFDEKLFLLCSDLSACKNLYARTLEQPFMRTGQWLWKSGALKFGSCVEWNLETVNTDQENFHWTNNAHQIKIATAGLYEITLAIFTKCKPSLQLVVNGESVLSAINSPSYVVHHSSGYVKDGDGRVEKGTVTGISLLVCCLRYVRLLESSQRHAIDIRGLLGLFGIACKINSLCVLSRRQERHAGPRFPRT